MNKPASWAFLIGLEEFVRNCNLFVFRDARKSDESDLQMYIEFERYMLCLGREIYRSGLMKTAIRR